MAVISVSHPTAVPDHGVTFKHHISQYGAAVIQVAHPTALDRRIGKKLHVLQNWVAGLPLLATSTMHSTAEHCIVICENHIDYSGTAYKVIQSTPCSGGRRVVRVSTFNRKPIQYGGAVRIFAFHHVIGIIV